MSYKFIEMCAKKHIENMCIFSKITIFATFERYDCEILGPSFHTLILALICLQETSIKVSKNAFMIRMVKLSENSAKAPKL